MITSASNAQVKNIMMLSSKAKARNKQDVFLVEGIRMFREVPAERLVRTYVSESFLADEAHAVMLKNIDHEIVSDGVFRQLSDTQTPQGVLGIVKQYHYTGEELFRKKNPCILILENLQDPGNLGTIFRTAEAAGVSAILMNKGCVDIYNPKTIRSTMGAVFRMPFIYTDDLKASILKIKEEKIPVFAAHLKGKMMYHEPDYSKGCAFMVGNEGNGLTDETAALADTYIRIPMEGRVESLNASVAASLLMYEAHRQQHQME